MNRRTLFKGIAALPLLKYLHLDDSEPVEAAPEPEPAAPEIDWPNNAFYGNPGKFQYLDGGPIDLGITRSAAICEPLFPPYVMFYETFERPIRDALPVIRVPRGGISYLRSE